MTGEDHELIAACMNGHSRAFDELVRRYQDRLYNVVYRYLGSSEDAQDVVQEAFVSAYQALSGFKGGSRFFTWLYRIAMNHAIDHKRRRKMVLRLAAPGEDGTHPQDPSQENQPGAALERMEEGERIQRALRMLSDEHRIVLIMKDLDGLKYEDMAEALSVPVGTIRSRLHRARVELREIVEREELQREGKSR